MTAIQIKLVTRLVNPATHSSLNSWVPIPALPGCVHGHLENGDHQEAEGDGGVGRGMVQRR